MDNCSQRQEEKLMEPTVEELAEKHFDGMQGWAEMLYHTEHRWGDWNSLDREERFKCVRTVVAIMCRTDRVSRGLALYGLLLGNQVQILYTIAKPFRKLILSMQGKNKEVE